MIAEKGAALIKPTFTGFPAVSTPESRELRH
jgi:hypothetical protein